MLHLQLSLLAELGAVLQHFLVEAAQPIDETVIVEVGSIVS